MLYFNIEGLYILISGYCNTEFWSLSLDQLHGYIKARALSISDSFILPGTQWFWTGTYDFSQDESQDSPELLITKFLQVND